MRDPLKPLLLSGLVFGLMIGSSQAQNFDPHEALRQQEAQRQAQQVRDEQALYERYRNKQTASINNDGTVTIGNLQWMRCSLGQQWNGSTCTGLATEHNWNDARALPGLMNAQGGFAGHSDWRLPTISELASLRVCSSGRASDTINLPGGVTTFGWCSGDNSPPSLDTRLFPFTRLLPNDLYFWSASPYAGNSDRAWYVYFGFGDVDGLLKFLSYRVLLVRGGQ